MPINFFDVLDGGQVIEDDVGQDLPSLEAAHDEAIGSAREQIGEAIKYRGLDISHRRFRVRNQLLQTIFVLPFSSCIDQRDRNQYENVA
jgi:hypothetical protein